MCEAISQEIDKANKIIESSWRQSNVEDSGGHNLYWVVLKM